MDERLLEDLGFTPIEAKIYLCLVSIGPSPASPIIKRTGLHKATVYLTIDRLADKGIIGYSITNGTKIFHVTNPDILLQKIKEKEEKLIKSLPELKEKIESTKKKAIGEVFVGREGIISVYRDVLTHKEYLHIGAGTNALEVLGTFFYQIQKIKKEKKIKARLLIAEKHRDDELGKNLLGEIKYLPKDFENPINTLIYGNKIAIILWNDLMAFVLESKETNDSYRKYFEVLWKIAKL